MSTGFPCTKSADICSILVNSDYAKSVTVPEAKQHQDGYTVYKIILQAIKVKGPLEENPLSFTAWKRFRDLHKLHRRIILIHAQLYLKAVVPAFPKPDFFGRLEPSVVEERRQASECFLSFVVQNSILCKCEAVLAFFSGAESDKSSESPSPPAYSDPAIPSSCPPPLSPISAGKPPLANLSGTGRSFSESSDISDDLPHPTQSMATKSDQSQAVSTSTDLLAAFDPLFGSSPAGGSTSSRQLLSDVMHELQIAVTENGEDQQPTSADDNVQSRSFLSIDQKSSPCIGSDTRYVDILDRNSIREDGKRKKKWRTRIADFFPRLSPSSSKYNVDTSASGDIKSVKSESQLRPVVDEQTGDRLRTSQSARERGGKKGGSSPVDGRRASVDYVIQAAEFISSAQKAEDENAFDLAFTCYKSAVMLLLQGVQDEKDLNRRNAVRLKTAKYLKKAENLYAKHIANDATISSYCLDGFTSRFLSNFGIAGFQSVYSELSQYKVLHILSPKVQLVQDISSGEKYAVKFLDKSCYSSTYTASKILDHSVPTRVPHMVKLVKFWDTESSVILLLEYATGGKLWTRLRSYLEKARRLFQTHSGNGLNGVDDSAQYQRQRSESAEDLSSVVKKRTGPSRIGCGRRSGSDPGDRSARNTRIFSVASRSRDESDEEIQRVETTLFDEYERQSRQHRRSMSSLDTPPPSAFTSSRCFTFSTGQHPGVIDNSDEYPFRKWIAQITVALGYLHSEGVICRDLNPENILVDEQDNVFLTFFCNWSGVDRPFNNRLASMQYSAPEVDGTINEPLNDAADWWSLGVILYEIATGMPLHVVCPHGVGPNTIVPLPDYLSIELRDLINRLIQYNAEDRLGACLGGVDEIKMHPFFMHFDWRQVEPS